MRPIFHFTEKRIDAHICICFVTYKESKELERVIKKAGLDLSVDKVLDTAKTLITSSDRGFEKMDLVWSAYLIAFFPLMTLLSSRSIWKISSTSLRC